MFEKKLLKLAVTFFILGAFPLEMRASSLLAVLGACSIGLDQVADVDTGDTQAVDPVDTAAIEDTAADTAGTTCPDGGVDALRLAGLLTGMDYFYLIGCTYENPCGASLNVNLFQGTSYVGGEQVELSDNIIVSTSGVFTSLLLLPENVHIDPTGVGENGYKIMSISMYVDNYASGYRYVLEPYYQSEPIWESPNSVIEDSGGQCVADLAELAVFFDATSYEMERLE